jgi:hypothetical protein
MQKIIEKDERYKSNVLNRIFTKSEKSHKQLQGYERVLNEDYKARSFNMLHNLKLFCIQIPVDNKIWPFLAFFRHNFMKYFMNSRWVNLSNFSFDFFFEIPSIVTSIIYSGLSTFFLHIHNCCEFESRSGEVYSIQHYMIKFVSHLWQVGRFLWV